MNPVFENLVDMHSSNVGCVVLHSYFFRIELSLSTPNHALIRLACQGNNVLCPNYFQTGVPNDVSRNTNRWLPSVSLSGS